LDIFGPERDRKKVERGKKMKTDAGAVQCPIIKKTVAIFSSLVEMIVGLQF